MNLADVGLGSEMAAAAQHGGIKQHPVFCARGQQTKAFGDSLCFAAEPCLHCSCLSWTGVRGWEVPLESSPEGFWTSASSCETSCPIMAAQNTLSSFVKDFRKAVCI